MTRLKLTDHQRKALEMLKDGRWHGAKGLRWSSAYFSALFQRDLITFSFHDRIVGYEITADGRAYLEENQ